MDRIVVLLATYNGARYLDAQLMSIATQRVAARIDVVVSDDGSRDGTLAQLAAWKARWTAGDFDIVAGPGRGFAENFRSLLTRLAGAPDYVAFSDQDDVWNPDKLDIAIRTIADAAGPALYCSRSLIVDAELAPIGRSPLFQRPPAFRNALVQSLAGGNTMVINGTAFELVAESARRTAFVSHDWWCYLLVSGAGGRVVYDPEPRIAYRQHGQNLVGHNAGWGARWQRLRRSMRGEFKRWNEINISALEACRDLLSADSAALLDQFKSLRAANALRGLYLLQRSGIYRQLAAGNISLALALILRKL